MQLSMPAQGKPPARFLPAGALAAIVVLTLAGLGCYLWHRAGRLTFNAEALPFAVPVTAPASGRLAFVDVQEGQFVRQGQILARFDNGALRQRLEAQRRLVAELELTLPPEEQMLPGPDGTPESLGQQEERRRLAEQEASSRLQAASEAEAQSAILYQRSLMLAARGSLTPEQLDAAEQAHARSRQAVAAAQADFERLSLDRAQSSADIRRLKELQAQSGTDRVPVQQRLRAYRQAREALALIENELAGSLILAPVDGVLTGIAARAGQDLRAQAVVMELTPTPTAMGYRATVPLATAAALRPGQPCRLVASGAGKPAPGVVQSVLPLPGGAESEVWIAPLEPAGEKPATPGVLVEVTVLLREQALDLAALTAQPAPFSQNREDAGQTRGAVAAPSMAAPPAAPLSVRTPFGDAKDPLARREPPPMVRSGSPQALGRTTDEAAQPDSAVAPPALPPMTAPRRLTGSPLPAKDNNPSIVRPRDLEAQESRP